MKNDIAVLKLIFAQTFAECYDGDNSIFKWSYKLMKLKVLIFLIVGLFLFGCDYQFREKPQTDENVNAANSQKNQNSNNQANQSNNANAGNSKTKNADLSGEPLILSGTSESTTFPCNKREVEVVEDATANSYTLTGECKKLTVDGVSNKVTVEKVGEIVVKGTSNKVTYGEGLDGKKPKITKSGVSTEVNSLKSLEEKKNAESK